jgi:hypothetical protein
VHRLERSQPIRLGLRILVAGHFPEICLRFLACLFDGQDVSASEAGQAFALLYAV